MQLDETLSQQAGQHKAEIQELNMEEGLVSDHNVQ